MIGRVLFRAESSPEIGFGHVARCLALAEALGARGIGSTFVASTLSARRAVERDGHEFREALTSSDPSAPLRGGDAALTASLARESGASLVIVDHYGAGPDYLGALAREGIRLGLIEDQPGRAADEVALVINPNLGAGPDLYPGREAGRLLAGPEFALVRAAFLKLRMRSLAARGGDLDRVLVALGGAAPAELLATLARELLGLLPVRTRIRLVVGPAAPQRSSGTWDPIGRIEIIGPLSAEELAEEMASCQAALATPSTICWELAALGVPMALIRTAANQVSASELHRRGIARVLAPGEPLSLAFAAPDGLCSESVRARLSKAAAELVDGLGASRCARVIEALAAPSRAGSGS